MKWIGIALIALGLIGFIFGGISYTTSEKVLDVGPIEIEAKQKESIPLTPIASGIAILAGAALLISANKKG